MTDPAKIQIPGFGGHGGSMKSKIILYAAVPSADPDQSVILSWKEEEGSDIMDSQMEAIGSCSLNEYGLTTPPGKGVWAFEGEVKVCFSKGGDSMEPQDYDSDISWEGEWRLPTNEEIESWRSHKATHLTHKLAEEKEEKLTNIEKGIAEAKRISSEWPKGGTPGVIARPVVGRSHYTPPSRSDWCACGKHVSECCCGESHGSNHHPSGRAYDEEDYEQFNK